MPAPAPTKRLSVEDWIDAGLGLLGREGITAVRVNRLCAELGVTKGSFYWHFTDLDAFTDALAERWGDGHERNQRTMRAMRGVEPLERVRGAVGVFLDQNVAPLDRAMREWATRDERARRAVQASDRYLHSFLSTAFRDLGFDAAEADLRAKTLYYAGVGFSHVGPLGRRGTAHQADELIALLTTR